jgi:putative membrane protein
MFSRSLMVNSVAAFVLAGSGWAQMQPPGNPQQPPNNGPPMGPSRTMPDDTSNNPQAQQVDPYVGDKDFVRNVAESSATEAQLGKIAQEKASSDAVKEFGKQMMEAHTQTGQELQRAATALKIDLPSEPPRKAKKDEEKLAKLSGADFDHAFAKMAADEQKQAVKQFEKEAKAGKSAALKDYAAKTLPEQQEREKQAEALNNGGTATAKQPNAK